MNEDFKPLNPREEQEIFPKETIEDMIKIAYEKGKKKATSDILEKIEKSINDLNKKENFSLNGDKKCCCQAELMLLKQKITNQQKSPRGYDVLPNGVSELCSHSADVEPEVGDKTQGYSGSLFNDICDNCIHNEVCYDIVEFGERQGECDSFISKQKIQGVKGE